MPEITRRAFLRNAGLGALALTAAGRFASRDAWAASAAGNKLNFVVILLDDLGWTDAGCCGSDLYETPNIDALARSGMFFTDSYAACPVCSPTRASLLTGKYPARLGFTGHRPVNDPKANTKLLGPTFTKGIRNGEVTIAQALKDAGYVCASIGKWDLGAAPSTPEKRGFDFSTGGHPEGMAASHFYPGWKKNVPLKGHNGDYLADRLTEEAEKFLQANRDKPFFVYLSHYSVHVPLEAKKEYVDKYIGKVNPGSPHDNPVYAAMIQSADDSVGRVMRKLEELGVADRTVVICTSDNGGLIEAELGYPRPTSNYPLREGKGYVYEGGIRVPLIINWPGVTEPGSRCSVPVCSVDLYRTMLDMIGRTPKAGQATDSVSLAPLLRGADTLNRDALYWHYPHYSDQHGTPASVIRWYEYKLIRFWEDKHVELYDLSADISEEHDLANELPDVAARLNAMLGDWLKRVGAKLPVPNPKYKRPK